MGYWAAFAAGGDPNLAVEMAPRVAWPRFTPADSLAAIHDFTEQHRCRFWRQEGLVAPTW